MDSEDQDSEKMTTRSLMRKIGNKKIITCKIYIFLRNVAHGTLSGALWPGYISTKQNALLLPLLLLFSSLYTFQNFPFMLPHLYAFPRPHWVKFSSYKLKSWKQQIHYSSHPMMPQVSEPTTDSKHHAPIYKRPLSS